MGDEGRYDVVWPLGATVVEGVSQNAWPSDLSGKTIAFIWDYLFKGPEMFSIIEEELNAVYSGLHFVDYGVFGNIHGSDPEEKANLEALPARLREHGVDAAVLAVGA